nr:uncharacterized protein I206_02330 [Kwoniella pini CBS 10737]OCF51615.1 hypothetical protein I206_02330 [Kwoniella pini CBS 10737]
MLRLTDEFKDADLVRTRDPAKLEPLDIVVDVGGVYSPEKHRYDHHQREFTEVFGHGGFDKIKLSSAGLVYKHFGKEIIANRLNTTVDDEKVETIWLTLYSEMIESVDGIDNGVNISSTPLAYTQRTDLSSRVKRLNPNWNEEATDAIYDEKFSQASKITGEEFLSQLDYFAFAWLPARDIVKQSLNKRFEVDKSGQIVVFDKSCPWKDHLFLLEPELSPNSKILYILYPESSELLNSKWRIQCVPESSDSFKNRKSLPEPWCGLRDETLSEKSGIQGGIFVHTSGFIGGNLTFEGCLEMAKKALEYNA